MERNCGTCKGELIKVTEMKGTICADCTSDNLMWQPKEVKKTGKIQFEDEEQLRAFLQNCLSITLIHNTLNVDKTIDGIISNSKKHGYIKQSELELAKEKYTKQYIIDAVSKETYENYIDKLEKALKLKGGE